MNQISSSRDERPLCPASSDSVRGSQKSCDRSVSPGPMIACRSTGEYSESRDSVSWTQIPLTRAEGPSVCPPHAMLTPLLVARAVGRVLPTPATMATKATEPFPAKALSSKFSSKWNSRRRPIICPLAKSEPFLCRDSSSLSGFVAPRFHQLLREGRNFAVSTRLLWYPKGLDLIACRVASLCRNLLLSSLSATGNS